MSVTCKLQQVTSLSETYHIPQDQVREFSSALIHLPGHSPVPHSTPSYTFRLYRLDAPRQCTAPSLYAGWKSSNWKQTHRANWDVACSRLLDQAQVWFPALYITECGQAYMLSQLLGGTGRGIRSSWLPLSGGSRTTWVTWAIYSKK